MHEIQSAILGALMDESPRRFSRLKPRDTESNLFLYHLNKLIAAGYIAKDRQSYGLTNRGRLLLDSLSSDTLVQRTQPKVLVEVACQNERGEWLLFRRKKQPYSGMVGFPSGRIHLGETVLEAATRELLTKTGFHGTLVHRGNIYFTTYTHGNLESHLLTHVFTGEIKGGELIEKMELGEAFWQAVPNTTNLSSPYFPGFTAVIKHISNPSLGQFFAEYIYHDNSLQTGV